MSHLNGKQIGEYSLSDYPVKKTEDNEIIEYGLALSGKSKSRDKVFVKINWNILLNVTYFHINKTS